MERRKEYRVRKVEIHKKILVVHNDATAKRDPNGNDDRRVQHALVGPLRVNGRLRETRLAFRVLLKLFCSAMCLYTCARGLGHENGGDKGNASEMCGGKTVCPRGRSARFVHDRWPRANDESDKTGRTHMCVT